MRHVRWASLLWMGDESLEAGREYFGPPSMSYRFSSLYRKLLTRCVFGSTFSPPVFTDGVRPCVQLLRSAIQPAFLGCPAK